MARYPVTIAQFRAFVEDCFRDGKWHLPPGFEGEFPHEEPPQHRASGDSHGADGVSWHDASAFCHWLGARLKAKIRLPTEAEWQLAATGGDPERSYPWGDEWDPEREPWRANTAESGLERHVARRVLPAGRLAGRRHGHGRKSVGVVPRLARGWATPCAARRVLGRRSGQRALSQPRQVVHPNHRVTSSAFVWCVPPHNDLPMNCAHAPAPGMGDRVMPQTRSNSRA